MPFMSKAPVKVAWGRLHDAAMASDAAYAVYPAIDNSGWQAVSMRTFGGGAIPRKNIGGDPLTFVTDDGRGAAVLLHSGAGPNKKYMLAFRGTDFDDLASPSRTDVIGWIDTISGQYISEFRALLVAVDAHLRVNPGQLTISGHSLGGWIVNKLKGDIGKFAGDPDIWNNAVYTAFESPLVRKGVFNFGFQNDPVYKMVSPSANNIGPERLWVDNGPGLFAAHNTQAYIHALHLLQNGTFSPRIDFTENVFIRTSQAGRSTFDAALIGAEGLYNSTLESFYYGSAKSDVFRITLNNTAQSFIDLSAGNDTLHSIRNAREIVVGKQGADTIFAGAGNDIVSGDGHFANHANVPKQAHLLDYFDSVFARWFGPGAGSGNIYTAYGHAMRHAGAPLSGKSDILGFNDKLYGEGGNDVLFAGGGNDLLQGEQGSDLLLGGRGNDTLNGNVNNDVLHGGLGTDRLFGGIGDDLYIIDALDFLIEAKRGGRDTAVIVEDGSYSINNVEQISLADGVRSVALNIMELDGSLNGSDRMLTVLTPSGNVRVVINNNSRAPTDYYLHDFEGDDNDTFVFTKPFVDGSSLYGDRGFTVDVSQLGIQRVFGSTIDISRSGNIPDGIFVMHRTSQIRFRNDDGDIKLINFRDYDFRERKILDDSFDENPWHFVGGIVSVKNGIMHKIVDLPGGEWDWIIL